VWAIEPNRALCQLLNKTLVANWYQERVTVLNCAASANDGSATFAVSPLLLGGGSILGADDLPHKDIMATLGETLENDVKTISLDNYFDECTVLRAVKLDIEGHEEQALRGAWKLLERHQVDWLIVEYLPSLLSEAKNDATIQVFRGLQDLGYRVGHADWEGRFIESRNLVDAVQKDVSRNLVFAAPHASQ